MHPDQNHVINLFSFVASTTTTTTSTTTATHNTTLTIPPTPPTTPTTVTTHPTPPTIPTSHMEVLTAAGPPMEAPMEAPMEDERMHQRQLQASCLDARQRVASENKGFAERRLAGWLPPASQQPFTVPNSLCKLPFNKDLHGHGLGYLLCSFVSLRFYLLLQKLFAYLVCYLKQPLGFLILLTQILFGITIDAPQGLTKS